MTENISHEKFKSRLEDICQGGIYLPNFKIIEPIDFVNTIAACGHSMETRWGKALIRHAGDTNDSREWAMYFLTGAGMGSPPHTYGGGGYVAIYNAAYDELRKPLVGTFAICQHNNIPGADANPRRGWHPGRCAKCGIDLSIDSGD